MPKNKILIIYLFLTVATFLAFWQVTDSDFIALDDGTYVTDNSHVRDGLTLEGIAWAFTAGYAANWHPLTWISHMLDVQLFGLNPHGHHLVNLLFHLANTALLFFVLHRMTKALWQSVFVAALFALHPLHVESVAWVAERKDVLSTFFWMLTLWAYSSYAERKSLGSYLPVVVFFALGLMAKPMLVTLPFVLLLLDYWPLERFEQKESTEKIQAAPGRAMLPDERKGKSGKKHALRKEAAATRKAPGATDWPVLCALLREKIPLFVLVLLSSVVTYLVQQKVGAVQPVENLPLSVRAENAFVSYSTYVGQMIWPSKLAFFYPYQIQWAPWHILGAVLFFLVTTVIVIRAAKSHRYLIVGWLWYVGTLVPVIGLVQVGEQARADRYTYIPLIGLFIMAAWGIQELLGKWRYRKPVLLPLSALVLLCFFSTTMLQVKYWQSNFTLSDHALKVTDNNHVAYYIRGIAYAALGNYGQAIKDYDQTIGIDPNYTSAYYNRGNAYAALGNYGKAIKDYDRAVEINPGLALAYTNRGIAYAALGNYEQAIKDYDRTIGINPNYAAAYNNRGNAYAALGNYEQAIKDYDRTIGINPNYAAAYNNRGNAYAALGNYEQAIKDYDRTIGINPNYARVYRTRGAAYYAQGSYDKSISDYGKAIERDPKDEYSRIMLLLTLRKVSKERAASSMDALRTHVTANTSTAWIRTIAKYYLGMDSLTEKRVLEEAQHGKTDKEIRQRLCEAYYYLGEERLWKGNGEGAREFFQKSVETNEYRFDEYRASKAMLSKMGSHKN